MLPWQRKKLLRKKQASLRKKRNSKGLNCIYFFKLYDPGKIKKNFEKATL